MDACDFETSRINKELSFDLVSKTCKDLGTADGRLYIADAERGISRIQDRRCKEGEADLNKALWIRKALGNYISRLASREKTLGKNDRDPVRTGLILYVLGSLHAALNQREESFRYDRRVWHYMRETVVERDVYTANITHKMANADMNCTVLRSGDTNLYSQLTKVNIGVKAWAVFQVFHFEFSCIQSHCHVYFMVDILHENKRAQAK
ncbi:hypothetical protein N7447_002012 [Penicillium robsamsonii]|uniref:uncharacterized protein n=1 Tax=Penicillium robsamsonii TaxID=1792511 RepID=UPI0025498798|nr:uncharacterized protein N7447_002012 [Penicillium robsamsonii]KAJ5835986.1 hypothetical protein N7447_002012 [Penicillium robsamsonii]